MSDSLTQANNMVWNTANYSFAKVETKRQRQLQEQLMDKQNAFNERMWDKNALYNSPAEQRKRMLAAGLNPNSGEVEVGNMSAPTESAPAPNIPAFQYNFLEGMQALANVHKTEAEAKTADAMRDPQKALMDAQREQLRNQIQVSTDTLELNKFTSEWQKKIAEGNLTVAEKQQLVSEYNQALQEKIAEKNFKKQDEDIRFLRLQGNKVIAETRNIKQATSQGKEEFDARREYLGAKARKEALGEGFYGLYQLPDALKAVGKQYGLTGAKTSATYPFMWSTIKTQFPTLANILGY